jgi:hypothetical protein
VDDANQFRNAPVGEADGRGRVDFVRIDVAAFVANAALVA